MAAEDRISEAFARIEEELLDSLMRNMERHQAEETEEGFDWPQWQALQLSELSRYAQRNAHRMGPRFDRLNERIERAIKDAYDTGRADEEARLLEAVRNGWEAPRQREQGFFHAPAERLDALINATHNDMMRAEHAVLRKAEDDYRETIMDAAVYGTSGAGTYAQAIDMATNDFVRKGITGITYRNGSKHSISEYSRMAVRTATKRAALVAEGDMRREWGVHTVFINYREDACPECMVWQGQVLVDDVYSGGTAEEARDGGWPLLSEAMAQGLFHPNCKDTSSTYFEGITELPKEPTRAEIAEAEDRERLEGRLSEAEEKRREYERLHRFSMDEETSERYGRLEIEWYDRAAEVQKELDGFQSASGTVKIEGLTFTSEELPKPTGTSVHSEEMAQFDVYTTPDGIRLCFLKDMDPKDQSMTPRRAADLIASIPESFRNRIQRDIYFVDYENPQDAYWRRRYANFSKSYMVGGGDITVWASSFHDDEYFIEAIIHEMGHGVDRDARTAKGTWYSNRTAWKRAMDADHALSGEWSPTYYGTNSNAEDFAESVAQLWVDPERMERLFPNRTALVRKMLGIE